MSATFRVGVAGLIHDHVWNMLRWWKELRDAELAAVADANPPLRERARSEFGIPRVYEDYHEMLDREPLDILMVTVDNAGTVDVVEAAAAKKIHVMSEKPMAATLEQADRMLEATRKAGVQLMINWPTAWSPAFQTLDRLIREGRIGDVVNLRYRAAHQGPREMGCSEYFYTWLYDRQRNGAGALMDYCCYGANMARHWLGSPASVVGIADRLVKTDIEVEDNAIVLMKFPHAFAIAEASWTQIAPDGSPNPTVFGTKGVAGILGGKVRLAFGKGDPEWLDPETPAPGHRNGAEYFVSCLRSGTPVEGLCSPETSHGAQEILAAGLRSAETGCDVPLPLR
jgi:predicted dehydrogenase